METNDDIHNMDIPNLVRSNQYFQLTSMISNYEDTIQKIFESSKNSHITNNPIVFLWKINKNGDNNDLFPNIINLDLTNDIFNESFVISMNELLNNVVIMGPYVRSYFMNITETGKYKIRKEIYLYKIGDIKWDDIVDINKFTDMKTEYVYQDDEKKINLIKNTYKSPSHIIIQHGYLKRCGWYNNSFYVSSMFIIEMQKHIKLMTTNFRDPKLNLPYDPLNVYQLMDKDKTHPIKIIELIDYEGLTKISKKNIGRLFNFKTCIELCLDKYMKEEHPIIINQLTQMILYLSSFKYRRPPFIYAKMLGIDELIPDLYKLLQNIPNQYNITEINIVPETIDDINNIMIEILISKDKPDDFIDYINYCKQKINKSIINNIIKYESKNISTMLITKKMVDNNMIYYLILMTENLELIKELETEFDMEIAINYLNDILENGKIRSFYFLYDNDSSIINTTFEYNRNILHQIKQQGNYMDLIDLIMKLNPELINMVDTNNENPILYHSKYNPQLLEYFIDYEFDNTLSDMDGNIFLHNLCKHDCCDDILRMYLKRCPELINIPNKKAETPSIICCQNNKENMFYIIKGFGADLSSKDYYGNTVYHYICDNSMCIGIIIENTKNHFGVMPYDYCKISTKYYNFI